MRIICKFAFCPNLWETGWSFSSIYMYCCCCVFSWVLALYSFPSDFPVPLHSPLSLPASEKRRPQLNHAHSMGEAVRLSFPDFRHPLSPTPPAWRTQPFSGQSSAAIHFQQASVCVRVCGDLPFYT